MSLTSNPRQGTTDNLIDRRDNLLQQVETVWQNEQQAGVEPTNDNHYYQTARELWLELEHVSDQVNRRSNDRTCNIFL